MQNAQPHAMWLACLQIGCSRSLQVRVGKRVVACCHGLLVYLRQQLHHRLPLL